MNWNRGLGNVVLPLTLYIRRVKKYYWSFCWLLHQGSLQFKACDFPTVVGGNLATLHSPKNTELAKMKES